MLPSSGRSGNLVGEHNKCSLERETGRVRERAGGGETRGFVAFPNHLGHNLKPLARVAEVKSLLLAVCGFLRYVNCDK